MQLGIRLHDTENVSLEKRLEIAREQGFVCGHLALSKVISEHPVDVSALTPGLAAHIRRLFEKNEIDIAVLGCYLNLATPNACDLRKNQQKYMAHIRFASLLGAGVVGTETGAVNETYSYDVRNHTQEALDIFLKNVKPIISYAEKMGVIFAIEPVFKHIVNTPARAREVLDAMKSPNLQIIFDPVNLLDITNHQNQKEIIREAIDLLGDDIAVVHIKDYIVKDNELISVEAGSGEMDYTDLIRFIKEKKPYVHATLENTVPENAVKARMYIQGLWDTCNI